MKKILLIEDDSGILEALQEILEFSGFQTVAPQFSRIEQQLVEEQPDAVLLDIRLGGIDSREIMEFIKKSDELNKLPVIVVSADSNIEQIARTWHADEYLQKPFEMDELIQKITQLTS